jgi:hypothetical protein
MQVIGAGFGRTGTMSLKAALEELGFGKCYHMIEVFKHPSHVKVWEAAASGEAVDWPRLFDGYEAAVDFPVAGFYRELMSTYPNAKVLLTVRDQQRWYDSTLETIYKSALVNAWALVFVPGFSRLRHMVQATIWDRLFDGRFEDKVYAIQVFNRHNEEVKRVVPPEKLLVFNVSEGWKPLCNFLGVPVPEKPFPHLNDRRFIKGGFLLVRIIMVLLALGLIGLVAGLIIRLSAP